jgi:DNA-binding NarL/FixJ family response regulator
MLGVVLNKTERRVMELLLQGLRDKGIAPLIGRRPRTVTRIVGDVCNKLAAETRVHAAAIYMTKRDL